MTEPIPLPGLEPPPARASVLEQAVRRTITALSSLGHIDERHAARCALAVELAQIIDAKKRTGKLSTVANDARVLVELLGKLVPKTEEGTDAELRKAMDEWTALMNGGSAA